MARAKKDDPLKNALPFERPVRELDLEIERLRAEGGEDGAEPDTSELEERRDALLEEMQSGLTTWQRVQISRHVERPGLLDYVELIFRDVIELHGDRQYGDDKAMFTGLATIGDHKILLIGHRKGVTTDERIECNWGCAHPEGYRKALLKMRLAERLGLPVVSLVNTPGAYPGIGAEERGQASAIAWNLVEMATLRTPVISVIIGEGGSGGALGIAVADRLLVLENAYYSVISPEGCASILWKDASRAEEAAEALRLGSATLSELAIADEVLEEPRGGAHRCRQTMAKTLEDALLRHLDELCALPRDELLTRREAKYRSIGRFVGSPSA